MDGDRGDGPAPRGAPSAQETARLLPRDRGHDDGSSPAEQRFWFGVGVATFVVLVIGIVVFSLTITWGWLMLLVGLAVQLVLRVLFVRAPGSESGMVALDETGTVHLVAGEPSVRRLARRFGHGGGKQYAGSVLSGALFTVVPIGIATALMLVFDSPLPFVALAGTVAWMVLDLLRYVILAAVNTRRHGWTKLDAKVMVPLLALYASHRGLDSVRDGVPADDLAETVTLHPEDYYAAVSYPGVADVLREFGDPKGSGPTRA